MGYFADALDAALATGRYNVSELAAVAGIASHATISKLRKGNIQASPAILEGIINAYTGDPQTQWNLVIARCKDMVPEEFRPALDQMEWQAAEDAAPYRATDSSWDKVVETIRRKGLYNDDLRQSVTFLANVAS